MTLEDAGMKSQPPASRWAATISPGLTATDGQTLGYTWMDVVENWHQRAFTSFGDGHGVWETGGGPLLPFYARNFLNVRQWAAPVEPDRLMQTVVDLRKTDFHGAPDTPPVERRLGVTADKIQSHGLDLSKALKPSGTGLVWAAVEDGQPIEHANVWRGTSEPVVRASLVQVTNLGISVKDSPLNTLIFVTRLDTAAPVPGARVSIVQPDGQTKWTGTTGPDGVAIAPQTRLAQPAAAGGEFAFIVTAEKDGDVAYTGSDWNEGVDAVGVRTAVQPRRGGAAAARHGVQRSRRLPARRGGAFQGGLAHNTPDGIRLLPSGTDVFLTVRDSRNRLVDERTIKVNAWSSGEWTFTLPDRRRARQLRRPCRARQRPAEAAGAKPDRESSGGEDESSIRTKTACRGRRRCAARFSSPRTANRTFASTSTLDRRVA